MKIFLCLCKKKSEYSEFSELSEYSESSEPMKKDFLIKDICKKDSSSLKQKELKESGKVAYNTTPIERKERAERIRGYEASLPSAQKEFVEYLMNAYIQSGVDELGKDKLKTLLALKFGSVPEGINALGGVPSARQTFKDFQQKLYVG